MSATLEDFDRRLREWQRADAEAAKGEEQLRRALLDGPQSEQVKQLHRHVQQLRDTADKLITELLQDLKRISGDRRP